MIKLWGEAMRQLHKQLINVVKKLNAGTSMGVGTKIFIAFIVVTFTITTSIAYFATQQISQKIKGLEEYRARVVTEQIIEMIQDKTKSLEIYARLLADSPELEEALLSSNSAKIYEKLIPAKYYSGEEKILVYDFNRKLAAKIAVPSKENKCEDELMTLGLAGMTNSGYGVTENGLEMYAVTPVHFDPTGYGEGRPSGAILVDRHINDQDLQALLKRDEAEISVFFEGKLVASSLKGNLRQAAVPEILSAIAKGEGFHLVALDKAKNSQYVCTWRSIGDKGMLSVLVPTNDLRTINQELSREISGVSVIAGIIVFFCSLILANFLVKPLVKMLDTTIAITNGDFSQKVDVFSADEFGQLGVAINFMAERIRERIEQAEHLATVDGLTGLYNHRYFQQRLDQELAKAERYEWSLSLIIIDIDYFKQYNDNQGHPAGDRAIQQISQILRKNVRGIDLAARYGGEEFALILVNTGPEEAMAVGERIRKEVEEYPFAGRDEQPTGKVTISLGVAGYPMNAQTKDDLIKMADDALYKAKFISKNKVVLYYSVLDDLKTEMDKSERDLLNTIKTLVSVINSKDKYTYGHSERVVQYSTKIAEAMGLSAEEVHRIKVGAYLHDIGKIEIDRKILNMVGSLKADQQEILKQHPSWGAQIISSVKSLQSVVPVILHHHERFDGDGYPSGLCGEEIPLLARILKVADSYDAMTTSRPYQPKRTSEEAKQELVRCAGYDFDPDIVKVFLEVLESTPQLLA